MAVPSSRRGPLLVLAVLGGLVAACGAGAEVAAPEAAAATTTTTMVRTVPEVIDGSLRAEVPPPREPRLGALAHEVLLYGDSVAVLVADDLAADLDAPLVVDAVDCRRLDRGFTGPCGGVPAGAEVPSGLAGITPAAALLDDPATAVAVVIIANNAALDADDLDGAMAALAPLPRVWWVTARVEGPGWQDPNNALLTDLVARDPRAGLIDWSSASDGQGWLVDNVHPDPEGQDALAGLIAAHLRCDCTP